MPPPKNGYGSAICRKCEVVFERRSYVHVFCDSCAEWRGRYKKARWQKEQDEKFGSSARQQPSSEVRARQLRKKEACSEIGLKNAKGETALPDRSNAVKAIRIDFPNDGYLSKNSLINIGMVSGKPYPYVRKDIKKRKEVIGFLIRSQLRSFCWPRSKTFIDIMVQKHMVGTDAINVVDTVCDAIKIGLEVDDEWFCIGMLDWEVVKKDPKVFVQVSTYSTEHQRVCGFCWQIKPYAQFGKHSQNIFGISNQCISCSSFIRPNRT